MSAWTPERDEILKRLWSDGLSCSEVAREIGGITRNAVIGRVHRLGLEKRAMKVRLYSPRTVRIATGEKPARRGNRTNGGGLAFKLKQGGRKALEKPPAPKPSPVRALPRIEDVPLPISLEKPILDLTSSLMCRWVTSGEREASLFCGHKTFNGLPYCEYHARVAYTPHSRKGVERTAEEVAAMARGKAQAAAARAA